MHELRPIFLAEDDLLYSQRDECDQMYFILEGKMRLTSDLKDFILDSELLAQANDFDDMFNRVNRLKDAYQQIKKKNRPSIVNLVMF